MSETRPPATGLQVLASLFLVAGAVIGLRALFHTSPGTDVLIIFTALVLYPFVLVLVMTWLFVRPAERVALFVLAFALLLSAAPLLSTRHYDMGAIIVVLIPFGQAAVATVVCGVIWLIHRTTPPGLS